MKIMTEKNSRKNIERIIIVLAITLAALLSITNSQANDGIPNVIIYGNEKCEYCKEIISQLTEQKISFIYLDVEKYGTYQEEMFKKLIGAGFTTTAIFPVVDVKGQILMKPKFDDIKIAIAGENIKTETSKKNRSAGWRPVKNRSLAIDFNSIKKNLNSLDLIFYDDGSSSGKKLLKNIEKEKIPFTLKQLNKLGNAEYFNMSSKLSDLGYGNAVLFPVIEVRGEMIMNPSIEEVKILLIEMTAE